jgi:hypothetical protein
MNHNMTRRMAVGAAAMGAAAVLVVMGPGPAFAAGPATTAAATGAAVTTTTQVSNPRCTPTTFAAAQQVVEADLAGRAISTTPPTTSRPVIDRHWPTT